MGVMKRLRAYLSRNSKEAQSPVSENNHNSKPAYDAKNGLELETIEEGVMTPLEVKHSGEPEAGGSNEQGDQGGRVQWTSPTEFLLTCIGFSVGLGNVWRFPYLCYKNGGGAFLIPYTLMITTIGVPLLFMEYASGQYFGIGSLSLFKTICPMFKGLGLCYFVLNSLVCVYYNVIIALALYYIFSSFTSVLPWSHCNNTFNTIHCGDPSAGGNGSFDNLTSTLSTPSQFWLGGGFGNYSTAADMAEIEGSSPSEEFFRLSLMGEKSDQTISNIGEVRWKLCLCLLLAWILVAIFVCRGIKSSGKVSYLTTTFPYVMLTVLVVRGVTLDGSMDGIVYFIVPQWQKLLDAEVWFQAAIQMFYALNLAWGGMITMSSYNQLNHNCYRDAIVINLVSFGTSLYAGIAVFAIIGFMAKEQGIEIQDVIKTGPGLAFVVYPRALSLMPAAPFFSVAFFFMLFLLGVGSQMVCVETIITGIMDTWHFLIRKWQYRVCVISVVSSFLFFLGIPCTTQGGMYVLQLMDHYAAGFSVLIIAVFECVIINWVYGHARFKSHIFDMLKYSLNPYWSFSWKFFSPALIVVITVFSFVKYKPVEYGHRAYPAWAEVLGWALALCSSLPIFIFAIYVFIRAKGLTWREKLMNATRSTAGTTSSNTDVQQNGDDHVYSDVQEYGGGMYTDESVENAVEDQKSMSAAAASHSEPRSAPINIPHRHLNNRPAFDRTIHLSESCGSKV